MTAPDVAAAIAFAGMAAFLATGVAAQCLHPGLGRVQVQVQVQVQVPNSFCLIGPWGGMVRAGHGAMVRA